MPRALARIHHFSYVSLNFSTETIQSFTKGDFCFQPFFLTSTHSIRLHSSLAETITGFLVLLCHLWQPHQCPQQLWLSLLAAGQRHLEQLSAGSLCSLSSAFCLQGGDICPYNAALAGIPALQASCRQCKYITDGPLPRMMALQRGGMLEPWKRCW